MISSLNHLFCGLIGCLLCLSLSAQPSTVTLIQQGDERLKPINWVERPDGGLYVWQQPGLYREGEPIRIVRFDAQGRQQAQRTLPPHMKGISAIRVSPKPLLTTLFEGYWTGKILEIYAPVPEEAGQDSDCQAQWYDGETLAPLGEPIPLPLPEGVPFFKVRNGKMEVVTLASGRITRQVYSPDWDVIEQEKRDAPTFDHMLPYSIRWLDNGDCVMVIGAISDLASRNPSITHECLYVPFSANQPTVQFRLDGGKDRFTEISILRATPDVVNLAGFYVNDDKFNLFSSARFPANGLMLASLNPKTRQSTSERHPVEALGEGIRRKILKRFDDPAGNLSIAYADSIGPDLDALVIEFVYGVEPMVFVNKNSRQNPAKAPSESVYSAKSNALDQDVYYATIALGITPQGQLAWKQVWEEKRPTSDRGSLMGSSLVFARDKQLHFVLNEAPQLWAKSDILWRTLSADGTLQERTATELSDEDHGFKPIGSYQLPSGRLLLSYGKRKNFKLKLSRP